MVTTVKNLLELPDDIINNIFEYIDDYDLHNMLDVNTYSQQKAMLTNLNKDNFQKYKKNVEWMKNNFHNCNQIKKVIENPKKIFQDKLYVFYFLGALVLNPSLIKYYKLPFDSKFYYRLLCIKLHNSKCNEDEHIFLVLYKIFKIAKCFEGVQFLTTKVINYFLTSEEQNFRYIDTFFKLIDYDRKDMFIIQANSDNPSLKEMKKYIYNEISKPKYSNLIVLKKRVEIFSKFYSAIEARSIIDKMIYWLQNPNVNDAGLNKFCYYDFIRSTIYNFRHSISNLQAVIVCDLLLKLNADWGDYTLNEEFHTYFIVKDKLLPGQVERYNSRILNYIICTLSSREENVHGSNELYDYDCSLLKQLDNLANQEQQKKIIEAAFARLAYQFISYPREKFLEKKLLQLTIRHKMAKFFIYDFFFKSSGYFYKLLEFNHEGVRDVFCEIPLSVYHEIYDMYFENTGNHLVSPFFHIIMLELIAQKGSTKELQELLNTLISKIESITDESNENAFFKEHCKFYALNILFPQIRDGSLKVPYKLLIKSILELQDTRLNDLTYEVFKKLVKLFNENEKFIFINNIDNLYGVNNMLKKQHALLLYVSAWGVLDEEQRLSVIQKVCMAFNESDKVIRFVAFALANDISFYLKLSKYSERLTTVFIDYFKWCLISEDNLKSKLQIICNIGEYFNSEQILMVYDFVDNIESQELENSIKELYFIAYIFISRIYTKGDRERMLAKSNPENITKSSTNSKLSFNTDIKGLIYRSDESELDILDKILPSLEEAKVKEIKTSPESFNGVNLQAILILEKHGKFSFTDLMDFYAKTCSLGCVDLTDSILHNLSKKNDLLVFNQNSKSIVHNLESSRFNPNKIKSVCKSLTKMKIK